MKPLEAIKNNAGGYDLMTERDAGNGVRILTGRYEKSLEYWKRLAKLCEETIYALEEVEEGYHEHSIIV